MNCRVFLLLLFFSASVFAKSKNREFTAAEFQKLSHHDQVEFISELRSIMAGLSRDPGLFSQFLQKWNFLLEINPFENAIAADPKGKDVHSSEIVYYSDKVNSASDGLAYAKVIMEQFRKAASGKTVIGDREAVHLQRAVSTLYAEATKVYLKGGGDSAKKELIRSQLQEVIDEANQYSFAKNCSTPSFIADVTGGVNTKLGVTIRVPSFRQSNEFSFASSSPKVEKAVAEANPKSVEPRQAFSDKVRMADPGVVIASGSIRSVPTENTELLAAVNRAVSQVKVEPTSAKIVRIRTLANSEDPASTQIAKPEIKVADTKPIAQDIAKVKAVAVSDANKTGNYEFSACMFGGFVLKGLVCKAPRELPENFLAEKIFDPKKYVCPSGELICNPMLFGFEWPEECDTVEDKQNCFQQAKPVCTVNNVRATAACKDKTKSKKYLDRATLLAKQNPKLLDQLLSDFKQLCSEGASAKNRFVNLDSNGLTRSNSSYFQKDIESTCQVARTRWEEVGSKYFQRAMSQGSGRDGSKDGGKSGELSPGSI